jgi:multidrug efflux system membrane fusion protein
MSFNPLPRSRSAVPSRAAAFCAAAGVAAAVLAGCGAQAPAEDASAPAPVSVSRVIVRSVQASDGFNGRIEAIGSVDVRPRVSGYIERVHYVEGQEVRKGDVLFSIDDHSHRIELERATAALDLIRVRARLADAEAERAQALARQSAIPHEVLEQRMSAAEQIQAEMRVAKAAVDQARLNLEWTKVRAPTAGRTGRALVTTGNLVATDGERSLLTTLVPVDKVHVYFDVDEATYVRQVTAARGAALPVRVGLLNEAGYPHEARLDFLDNRMARATGTISARALLDNPLRRFTPGLYARVQLPSGAPVEAVLINDRAVLTDQDRKYVYVVDAENRAQRREVTLGRLVNGLRIVEQGLQEGDRVVLTGMQRIFFPGMPVTATQADMPVGNASVEVGS